MLRRLFETQEDVLQKAHDDIGCIESFRDIHNTLPSILVKLGMDYFPQIDRMTKDCTRVQQSLLDILDLQQERKTFTNLKAPTNKHYSPRSKRYQLKTRPTPPTHKIKSFSSSQRGDGDSKNHSSLQVERVLGRISGPLRGVLLISAVAWTVWGRKRSARKRTRELVRLHQLGCLPAKLIDPTDPEYKRMQDMGAEFPVPAAAAQPSVAPVEARRGNVAEGRPPPETGHLQTAVYPSLGPPPIKPAAARPPPAATAAHSPAGGNPIMSPTSPQNLAQRPHPGIANAPANPIPSPAPQVSPSHPTTIPIPASTSSAAAAPLLSLSHPTAAPVAPTPASPSPTAAPAPSMSSENTTTPPTAQQQPQHNTDNPPTSQSSRRRAFPVLASRLVAKAKGQSRRSDRGDDVV
ncbi:hypothetical protein K402DRAFT_452507 [Aulographum hederae CBS 113979]|uniref:Uncharacterized protein n=1 Tax=Aulographum hederae CBS 113979 TaxID=1176131 RepID=A0A6G1H6Q5_9PEZI|nr:hypothetical protein K402DRAFT_452507 [Aulographum hederae CBS 113979]